MNIQDKLKHLNDIDLDKILNINENRKKKTKNKRHQASRNESFQKVSPYCSEIAGELIAFKLKIMDQNTCRQKTAGSGSEAEEE